MRIDKVIINVHAPEVKASNHATSFLDSLLQSQRFARGGTLRPVDSSKVTPVSTLTPPAIGATWPGQGGIYGGVVRGVDGQPDAHIVVSTVKPAGDLAWQPALDWAKTVEAEGHRDFALPTRFQAPILYGNLRDLFETSGYYWTSTEYSERGAWVQLFSDGSQNGTGKSYEARAVAVRLIPIKA